MQADAIVGADGINSNGRPHIYPDVSSGYTGGMSITGLLKKKDMRVFEFPLPCVSRWPAGQFALGATDESQRGGVLCMDQWSGEEREAWRVAGQDKEDLRKIIITLCFGSISHIVHGLITETL